MTGLSEVGWPAILFGRPRCAMRRIDDPGALTKIRYAGLDAINRMDEYFLVDSAGLLFHLKDARMKRSVSALGRALLFVLNPLIECEYLRISSDGKMDANALRDRMLQDIRADYEYWSDMSDIEDRITEIKKAQTIEELVKQVP